LLRSGFTQIPVWGSVTLCGVFFLLAEAALSADKSDNVALPKLPKNAGKIDHDAPDVFQTTKSGLKYRVLRKGTGANPTATATVKVHYHGWLSNGKVFDSSYNRGESISFPLNRVIADAIQVHGGIGFTWEHDLHLYFKRVEAGALSYGNAVRNRELVAELLKL